MKYVADFKAGKAISAWVILNKEHQHVGTVQAHYADSGTVTVNLFTFGEHRQAVQAGKADGSGYNKLAAVLSGMSVDGVLLTDYPNLWDTQLEELGYTVIQAI